MLICKFWGSVQACTAAVSIQSAFRGFSVRSDLGRQILAVTAIQACWRSFIQKRKYQCLLESRRRSTAAVCIQRYWQVYLQRRWYLCLLKERSESKAAICIQRHWRGYLIRLDHHRRTAAVVRIQAEIRHFLARQRFVYDLSFQISMLYMNLMIA